MTHPGLLARVKYNLSTARIWSDVSMTAMESSAALDYGAQTIGAPVSQCVAYILSGISAVNI